MAKSFASIFRGASVPAPGMPRPEDLVEALRALPKKQRRKMLRAQGLVPYKHKKNKYRETAKGE